MEELLWTVEQDQRAGKQIFLSGPSQHQQRALRLTADSLVEMIFYNETFPSCRVIQSEKYLFQTARAERLVDY